MREFLESTPLERQEGSRIRNRETLSFDAVSVETAADPAEISEFLVSFRTWTSLGVRAEPLTTVLVSHWMLTPQKRELSWLRWLFSTKAVPAGSWHLRAISSGTSSIWGNMFFIPEGGSVPLMWGKGEETNNYTKMSFGQPWRYAQSIMDAQKRNLIQSCESWRNVLNKMNLNLNPKG